MIKIAVVLEPCEEGGFSVHVPTIPGCFSEGETVEQALDRIREAIELHLEAVEDDLVVEDESKVFELVWEFTKGARSTQPYSLDSTETQSRPTAEPDPPAHAESSLRQLERPVRKVRRLRDP
jgi:predicted RNase H-like HicB family nuclease